MIYRDALGAAEPRAGLDCRRDIYGRAYWLLHAASDFAGRRFASADEALAWAGGNGWRVVARRDGLTPQPQFELEHIETAAAMAQERQAEAEAWRGAKPCYLRFGRPPQGGRSRNHRDGLLEAGVSVYRGAIRADGQVRFLMADGALGTYGSFAASSDPLYIVRGRELGVGSDGEPLLADCRIVKRLR
jgi:hypothetical protein